ncbi:ATP-binding protein [Ancylobacter lacus]|uniref:ATP-binding protein n=1 Tax=Ancylobacter lacus TaxID=2579970 RepID=UPI001BD06026|nr:ATP-binding protein [Ancylobacter lacus]MBS7538414.1 hypothetical protein [Ancylobacter lacus]
MLLAVLMLLACAVPVSVAVISIRFHERHEVEESVSASRRIALVLLSNFERTVESIDTFLTSFGDIRGGDAAEQTYARLRDARLPASVIQISFVSAAGAFITSNIQAPGKPFDLTDREHIRVHLDRRRGSDGLDREPPEGIFLSKPVKGRITGAWSIQFSKAIRSQQNELEGIVVASYQISDFIDFYRRLRPEGQGLIALIGTDGVVRASVTPEEHAVPIAGADIVPGYAGLTGGEGVYDASDPATGVSRVGYYIRSQRYPFMVVVAADRAEVLNQSREFRLSSIILASTATLTLFVIGALALRFARLERRLQRREAQADARRREARVLRAISQVPGIDVISVVGSETTRIGSGLKEPLGSLVEERVRSPEFLARARASDAPPVIVEHFARDGEEFEVQMVVGRIVHVAAEDGQDEDAAPDAIVVFAVDQTAKRFEENQLYQMSKMAALGELVTGLAHEINQPLGVIRLAAANVQTALAKGQPTQVVEDKIGRIIRQVERMKGIIDHMRIFGRRSTLRPEAASAANAISGVLQVIGADLRIEGIQLHTDIDPPEHLNVLCREDQLEQVLINLLLNARDALRSRQESDPGFQPEVWLSCKRQSPPDHPPSIRIVVRDNGGGIPEKVLAKVFQPFFTTKPAGKGTGLGLSVSFGIVRDHGGTLTVANDGTGAVFTITLPAHAEAEAQREVA